MQPAFSIPPLTEEGVKKLVGRIVIAPLFNPERQPDNQSTAKGKIVEVEFESVRSCRLKIRWITVIPGSIAYRKLDQVRFTNHCDDPVKIAIHRAQWEGKQLLPA